MAAMLLGGAPLKMRLKKSCRSAGLLGPVACSDGDLEGKIGEYFFHSRRYRGRWRRAYLCRGGLLFLEPNEMW